MANTIASQAYTRMIEYVREEVNDWLHRDLDAYYPIVFVDCVHIKVFRKKKAASEAFYVVLGVTEEGTREVLGIYNNPQESATGWGLMFDDLYERSVECIGLMVADGITGLDVVIGEKFQVPVISLHTQKMTIRYTSPMKASMHITSITGCGIGYSCS